MKAKDHGLRPALERKLQEYILRRQEFEQFKRLDHPYLKQAFYQGCISTTDTREDIDKAFNRWREQFAKEEYEKYKRERSARSQL